MADAGNTKRLSVYLSQNGISSRRKADEIIISGRIKVNNNIILEPYFKIDITKDKVTIDNHEIIPIKSKLYFALYKPVKYLSDLNYNDDRRLARHLIDTDAYIYPVGRLDYDSEGLMIFTNDGDLANIIMHPKYMIEKEYIVDVKGTLTKEDLEKVKKGQMIEQVTYKFSNIFLIKSTKHYSSYRVTLNDGKNRVIRKLCQMIGHDVLRLKRIRIGHIHLGKLKPGEYRKLKPQEILPFKIAYRRFLNHE